MPPLPTAAAAPTSATTAGRRQCLQAGLGLAAASLGGPVAAQATATTAASGTTPARLALLVGNRDYPVPHDLPPIPKNLRDLGAALEAKGFVVSSTADLSAAQARQTVAAFIERVRQSPPDAVVFFYFCGHGVQVDAANLLIAAGVNPAAPADVLQKGSLQLLQDVVSLLPPRSEGMTIAVIDACRTSLRPLSEGAEGGLNQVEAPAGSLIAFSTGAGRPAIAPAVETANTFYTASLVKLLNSLQDDVSFSDFFRLVKIDVEQTMLSHPVEAIRRLAQRPFIAENTRLSLPLQLQRRAPAAPPREEAADWERLAGSLWPAEIMQLGNEFARNWPQSGYNSTLRVWLVGADEAAKALQRADVRLYRSAFQWQTGDAEDRRRELQRVARGDKDAAARMARRAEQAGQRSRQEGWLQLAAALGNGIAAYELALFYRAGDQPLLAARFEARARELGYTPPASLDNVRK